MSATVCCVLVFAAKYYFYDNYFDLPGALLCGRVVDMMHKVIFDKIQFNIIGIHFYL